MPKFKTLAEAQKEFDSQTEYLRNSRDGMEAHNNDLRKRDDEKTKRIESLENSVQGLQEEVRRALSVLEGERIECSRLRGLYQGKAGEDPPPPPVLALDESVHMHDADKYLYGIWRNR